MVDDDTLEKRIDEETAKIKVESYQKVASLGGWSGGSRTLWAISTIGVIAGAAIGLVAPFFPMIVGAALPTLAIIGASVATFAATGLTLGFGGGLILGRISGSAAAVAQENEERMKEWTVRQMLNQNPDIKIIPDEPPQEKPPAKPFWQRVKDNYHTFINPRVGLAFAAIGVIGGLILAAAFNATGGVVGEVVSTKALEAIAGISATNSAAITAYTAGVCGAFGALWSFNFPKLTSEVTHFFGNLAGGKIIGREWAPKQEILKSPAESYIGEEQLSSAAVRRFESFQDMVAQQANQKSPETQIEL